MTAQELISSLNLQKHPEGGFYKEIYRSADVLASLPQRFNGATRNFCTGIYYLLADNDKSHFHRIKSDEIWHFYAGATVEIHIIDPHGNYYAELLGADIANGAAFQVVIPAGYWFAAHVLQATSYALCGCTVSPGFEFDDFEMANKEELLRLCPPQAALIDEFCL
ncbi:hypothetical protein GC194_12245 [bacterium]|nr:hypothetical protein [bacterium]